MQSVLLMRINMQRAHGPCLTLSKRDCVLHCFCTVEQLSMDRKLHLLQHVDIRVRKPGDALVNGNVIDAGFEG